jgi:hypothetical protein
MSLVRGSGTAIGLLCLFLVPVLPAAQGEPNPPPANIADDSLQRALSRTVIAEFPAIAYAAPQAQGTSQNQTPAPGAPSLGDLGFPTEQTQGSVQDQVRLDRRSHMLKMHQRFGLITLAPMIATIAVSGLAGGRDNTATGRDIHGALGAVTADLYFMTAYYALRAPRIPGTTTRGPIRLHKALAWIHGPGMILTPILGAIALSQESNGEKVHGIAKAHSAVAAVTYTSFGLALLSVSIKF